MKGILTRAEMLDAGAPFEAWLLDGNDNEHFAAHPTLEAAKRQLTVWIGRWPESFEYGIADTRDFSVLFLSEGACAQLGINQHSAEEALAHA